LWQGILASGRREPAGVFRNVPILLRGLTPTTRQNLLPQPLPAETCGQANNLMVFESPGEFLFNDAGAGIVVGAG
jgi:hypothetical protein